MDVDVEEEVGEMTKGRGSEESYVDVDDVNVGAGTLGVIDVPKDKGSEEEYAGTAGVIGGVDQVGDDAKDVKGGSEDAAPQHPELLKETFEDEDEAEAESKEAEE